MTETAAANAVYWNSDDSIELVVLDDTDCVLEVLRAITEAEMLAIFAGETEYKAVGHEIAVGDGDRFQRLVLR